MHITALMAVIDGLPADPSVSHIQTHSIAFNLLLSFSSPLISAADVILIWQSDQLQLISAAHTIL